MNFDNPDPYDLEDPLLVTIAVETMKIVEQKLSHLIFEPEQAWLYNIDSEDQLVTGTIVFKDTCVEMWVSVIGVSGEQENNRIVLDYANPDRFGPEEVCAAIRKLEKYARKANKHPANKLLRDINVQVRQLLEKGLQPPDA